MSQECVRSSQRESALHLQVALAFLQNFLVFPPPPLPQLSFLDKVRPLPSPFVMSPVCVYVCVCLLGISPKIIDGPFAREPCAKNANPVFHLAFYLFPLILLGRGFHGRVFTRINFFGVSEKKKEKKTA